MKKEVLVEILNTQAYWEILESFVLGDGSVIPSSRIQGFKRKQRYRPIGEFYQNQVSRHNFYISNDEKEANEVSLGTLEFDEEKNMIKFIDSTQGDTVWTDIDTICSVKFKPIDHPYYPGQTLG